MRRYFHPHHHRAVPHRHKTQHRYWMHFIDIFDADESTTNVSRWMPQHNNSRSYRPCNQVRRTNLPQANFHQRQVDSNLSLQVRCVRPRNSNSTSNWIHQIDKIRSRSLGRTLRESWRNLFLQIDWVPTSQDTRRQSSHSNRTYISPTLCRHVFDYHTGLEHTGYNLTKRLHCPTILLVTHAQEHCCMKSKLRIAIGGSLS